jgi:hypothetical protein
MFVKSTKHVDLRDGTYHGLWCGWVVTIPALDKNDVDVDLEFPVSRATPTYEAVEVIINVKNNKFSFER